MTEQITLDEVAETDLGREIIRQRNEAAQVKVDAEELTRKTRVDELQARAAELTEVITAKRTEVLALAASFADAFDELDAAFSDLTDARRHLRPLDEKLTMPQTFVKEPEVRRLIERVQAMARRFGRPL